MEVFDKDGNLVEGVFSQAEVDAKIEEAKKAFTPAASTPTPAAAPVTPAATPTDTPAVDPMIKALQDQISTLSKGFEMTVTNKFGTNLDADKKAAFEAKFGELSSLSSYDSTPVGLERRAADAYALVTGQPFNFDALNMGNLGVSGGKAPTTPNNELKEEDKGIAALLGNTPEDYKKFGSA